MRAIALGIALAFIASLVGVPASAQSGYTVVSAVVIDPNGFHYAGCHGSASFVPSPSATLVPTIGGSTFQTDVPIAGCDSFGAFTIVLADNNVVQDGHTSPPASQWRFNIVSQDGLTAFNCTMTITGATQNITAPLTACAAPLPTKPGGGGGGFIVTPETCASTMTFVLGSTPFPSANTAFTTTLNCNVTTTTVVATSGLVLPGTIAQFTFTQNGTGGFNVTWPANFVDTPLIQGAPNATTNASFWYDGTKWHAQTFPASGTGSPPSGPAGTIQSTNGSTFSSSNMTEAGGSLLVNENAGFKGPDPHTNVTVASHIRSVNPAVAPQIPGITVTISATSTTATLSSASTFQNGDGVLIPGAGATCSLSAPVGVTVTPSIAAGPTGTGITLPITGGSTSYSYEVSAWDKPGCYTAASAAGSTSTGTATLGAQSLAITGFTQSGNTVTATVSSAASLVAGAYVYISTPSSADAPYFGGWYYILSAGGTTFTYNTGNTVAGGAPTTSAGGGTVFYWYMNHVTWTANAAPYQYLTYGRTSGAYNLIGQTLPNNSSAGYPATSWDDSGATMLGTQTFPLWAPSTAPSTPLPDPLVTTILSGGTTTSLVLNAAATTSVTSGIILLDQGVEFAALAANTPFGGPLFYFPFGNYVFNSYTTIPGFMAVELACATITLNRTLEQDAGDRYFGMIGPQCNDATSFGWPTGGTINGRAYPLVWDTSGSGEFYEGIKMVCPGSGCTAFLMDGDGGGAQGHFKNMNFNVQTGAADYMSIPLYVRGGFWYDWDHISVNSGPGQAGGGFIGTTSTPALYYNSGGTFKSVSIQDRGMFFFTGGTGGGLEFYDESRTQGGITPFLTIYNTGGCVGGSINFFGRVEMDTTQQNIVANAGQCYLGSVNFNEAPGVPAGGYGVVTGNSIGGVVGNLSGQNNAAVNGPSFTNNPVSVTANGEFLYFITPPAAPGLAVSTGGSVPVGQTCYGLTVLDVNGNESTTGTYGCVTTSSGNQTVTVTPPAAPSGAVAWRPYRSVTAFGGALANIPGCSSLSFSSSFVDTFSFTCGPSTPTVNRAGSQTLGAAGLSGTAINLLGGGFKNALSGVFTANRATTFPDNSGTVSETNLAQTWSALQVFGTNISIGGVTATGATGTGNVVFSTNPVLTTPNLGTPSTLVLTNATGLPLGSTGVTGTLTVPNGGTGAGTFNLNGLLYGNTTSALQSMVTSGAGTFCATSTNGGAPTWAACSGSTSTSWSSLSNPSADLSLSQGTFNTLWTQGVMVGARNAFELTDGASTSTGSLWSIHTGASSTMKPITVTAQGTANGVQMSTAGVLAKIGSGSVSADAYTGPTLTVSQGGTGATTLTTNCLLQGNGTSAITCLVGSLTGTNPVLTLTSAATGNVPFALNTPASPTADLMDLNINSVKTSWFDNGANLHTPSATYTGSGPLTLSGTEGTCGATVAGTDIICLGDSATHDAQLSVNGGNFKPMVQSANGSPTSFGVAGWGNTFPQLVSSGAGTVGQPFLSGGSGAFGSYGPLNLAGGATIVTGIVPIANGGTGASSLTAANIVTVSGATTAGHCADWVSSTVVQDSGGTCGGAGGSPPLHTITAATAINTINSTTFAQAWNWALTGSTTAFKFGENAAATGANNIILQATTAASSTAVPFQTDNNGKGWQLTSAGQWQPLGGGTLSLPSSAAYAPTTAALFGYDSTNNRVVVGNGTNTSFPTWITAAPVSLDLAEFSGTLGLVIDTGILTANVVTQTSNAASGQVCTYTGVNKICVPATALPNGVTATTQTAASNDTKVATDAYVDGHFIANGTFTLGTSAIASGTCATVVTVGATGVATTDVITVGFNSDPTAVTGYGVSATGAVLSIYPYPTANNVNLKVCNSTGSSITPSAMTLNWKVAR